MNSKPKMVVFTGAGFSASISNKLLTTPRFYGEKILKSQYEKDARFHFIDAHLGSEHLDAEMFTRELQQVIDGMSLLDRDGVQMSLHRSGAYSINSMDIRQHLDYFRQLLDYIKRELLASLDCTDLALDEKKQIEPVQAFLSELAKMFRFNIVTTNYDNLFNDILGEPRYYLQGDRKTIDIDKLINDGNPYSYIPLKGVVGWNYFSDDSLKEHNPANLDLEQAFMIPFEWTSEPEEHLYGKTHKKLYDKFESDLREASVFLAIGFSFRDNHINKMIYRHSFDKVIIVTKSQDSEESKQFERRLRGQAFSNKNQRKKNIHHITSGFDDAAMKKILKMVRP